MDEPEAAEEREEKRERGPLRRRDPQAPGLLTLLALGLMVASALFTFAWIPGLLLAWFSRSWSLRDKAIATAIPLLGFVLFSFASFAAATEPGSQSATAQAIPLLGVELVTFGLAGAPLAAGLYLALRLRPRPQRPLVVVGVLAAFVAVFAVAVAIFVPRDLASEPTTTPVATQVVATPTKAPQSFSETCRCVVVLSW